MAPRPTLARRLLVAALAVAMTVVAVLTAAAAEAPSWQHVPVPVQVRPQSGLNEAAAFGPDRAWAVGADAVGREAPGFPLVLRWDGTAWQRQSLPGIRWQGELLSIAGTSPAALWAVGRDSAGGSRLLRFDGKSWRDSRPPAGVRLDKVVAGGGETWLIGGRDGGAALLRWDGRAWQDLPVPPGAVYGLHIKAATTSGPRAQPTTAPPWRTGTGRRGSRRRWTGSRGRPSAASWRSRPPRCGRAARAGSSAVRRASRFRPSSSASTGSRGTGCASPPTSAASPRWCPVPPASSAGSRWPAR
ncbi:hypothetical protein [Streptomyces alboflavus]|uniref:hypothetical protein n=1 Tax=Streptomyces alboflavus TaxID=67267 RepID=UPI001F247280|nr:hypothetical protein [Streptomyces alboflavus]